MRLTSIAVAAVVATTLAPAPARAQLGGLARRVAERAVKEKTSSGSQRAPITDDAVAHALAGFAEEARAADEMGRAALAAHAADVRAIDDYLKRRAAWEAATRASADASAKYEACAAGSAAELNRLAVQQPAATATPEQREMMQAMMTKLQGMSPAEQEALSQKMEVLETQAQAARKSGNVAEQRRIAGEIEKLTGVKMAGGPPTAAQTAANKANEARADAGRAAAEKLRKCDVPRPANPGLRPEAPRVAAVPMRGQTLTPGATETIDDSADARGYFARLRASSLGNGAVERGAAAAGVPVADYGLLRETLLMMYARRAATGEPPRPQSYTDDEWQTLGRHRAELVAALRRLEDLGAL